MALESSRQAPTGGSVQELFKRRHLEAEGVKLVVVNGVVYLDGAVASYQQKKALAAAAAALPDIRWVVNRLRVEPGGTRGDGQIRKNLLESFQKDPILSLYLISVSVKDGVVELRGRVDSPAGRVAAEALAWSVCGVRHVVNYLQVTSGRGLDPSDLALAIKRSLESCLGPPGSAINVRVDEDTAYLTGNVATADQSLIAEDLVRYHPLIRRVVNQIQVQGSAQPQTALRDFPASA